MDQKDLGFYKLQLLEDFNLLDQVEIIRKILEQLIRSSRNNSKDTRISERKTNFLVTTVERYSTCPIVLLQVLQTRQ
jgi:hypothetical protein